MPRPGGGPLTLEDFRGVVAGERRRDLRFPCRMRQVAIFPCAGETDQSFTSARLFDCSRRGLGIITVRAMKPGDQFLVKVRLGNMRVLVYTVRHCTPVGPREFMIGAEFAGIIGTPIEHDDREVLDALLSATTQVLLTT